MAEIFESHSRSRFRFGYRHPVTGKATIISQGSWKNEEDARREAEVIELNIVRKSDAYKVVHGMVQSKKAEVAQLQNEQKDLGIRLDAAEMVKEDMRFKIGSLKTQRTVFAIVGLIGVAGMIMAMVI